MRKHSDSMLIGGFAACLGLASLAVILVAHFVVEADYFRAGLAAFAFTAFLLGAGLNVVEMLAREER